ncbi:MAG: hypothetical protein KatS3mg055_2935 [Chloroflexus sp.]|uniref:hypothetical protein n=1 Tax=Chloroflexus sp. TaxID=1904827 RepID=UPI0021DF293C|nr:hypothetical protein [Chloroflexus sp.]GIV90417.1 MAG: hypothetical protein KatS3mg055_2935 [Chloroflexus sp.]
MINLLYHSHTIIPAHLEEITRLDVLDPDEQVLVAVDGVLLDHQGQRLSGPTLHDYCLITDLRVVLWARDYGRHLCYAFPLAELTLIDGRGIDPIHGEVKLRFSAPEAEEQLFTLTLIPQAYVPALMILLRTAAETARSALAAGLDARQAAPEVMTALGAAIYGSEDALRPDETPYRWPGGAPRTPAMPNAPFVVDPAMLPPNQIFTAGRLARSAWDTLRRTLREADLPFDLSPASIRELTEAIRAVNELVQTVTSNPAAQQMAMAFLNRQAAARQTSGAANPPSSVEMPMPDPPPATGSRYHEIPLRRRNMSSRETAAPDRSSVPPVSPSKPVQVSPTDLPDRREIPLRRRSTPVRRAPLVALSGSGDADTDQS